VSASPAILIRVDRRLLELLLPGAIAEAERLAQGFEDGSERESWIAGRLGTRLEQVLHVGAAA